jgi:maltose alpha-D-glucosyltransferase / alpha-amylase
MDPVYGYESVNVEAQTRNPSSLLHWMRRMLEVRRLHPVFGTGSIEIVSTDNPSVLAYIRFPTGGESSAHQPPAAGLARSQWGSAKPSAARSSAARPSPESTPTADDAVLCVSNLSRFAQPAQLPLQRWEGMTPIELLGRTPFPPIGELPYFVTLPPYGFYWFGLVAGAPSPTGD